MRTADETAAKNKRDANGKRRFPPYLSSDHITRIHLLTSESLSEYPEGFFVWWCVKHATHDAYYESFSMPQ